MSFYNKVLSLASKHKKVSKKISKITNLKGKSLIDIGGGSGLLSNYLLEYSKDITILEPSKEMLKKVDNKFKIINKSIQGIDLKKKYDSVICFDSMHHFSNNHENSRLEVKKGIDKMINLGKEVIIIEPNPRKLEGLWINFFENYLFRINSYFPSIEEYDSFLKSKNYTIEKWKNYLIIHIKT